MYIIEITDASEEYEAVRNRYVDKTQEEIKQEQDAFTQNLAENNKAPEEEGKSLDNLNEAELEKYSI